MTIRYVGPGGSDSNDGLSWANRKLTLNGVEDSPVEAGDTVYVGPGVYRETLVAFYNGISGIPITYVGDVTGVHTDGVGGFVRITGFNADDRTIDREYCISMSNVVYRTFRGFYFDGANSRSIYITGSGTNNIVVNECFFQTAGIGVIDLAQDAPVDIKRCIFMAISNGNPKAGVYIYNSSLEYSGVEVKCNLFCMSHYGIYSDKVYPDVWSFNTFQNVRTAVLINNLSDNPYIRINLFYNCDKALVKATGSQATSTYSGFSDVRITHTNFWSSNDVYYYYIAEEDVLKSSYRLASRWPLFPTTARSYYAYNKSSTFSYPETLDLFGFRNLRDAMCRGAYRDQTVQRATSPTWMSSPASVKLDRSGVFQICVPTNAEEYTFRVGVYRGPDYDSATLPQMVIRQPGYPEVTVTDTGPSGQWNVLAVKHTPQASPGYVIVEFVSHNNTSVGDHSVFFDDFGVY